MKTIYMKFFKEKNKIFLTALCTIILSITYSCVENEDTIYAIDDEPYAAIGFAESEATIAEGGKEITLDVNTSKLLFDDIMFDVVVVSGDATGVTISDSNGNETTSLSIAKGGKTTKLKFSLADDSKYLGTRKITFGLENLKGDGVFIPEENLGSSEKRVNFQFELTVEDDEPVPPSIGFTALSGEVSENATGFHKAIIKLTRPATEAGSFDIAFTGSAVADADYTSDAVNGVLSVDFGVGAETIEVEIAPIDNTVIDGDKTVVLTITNVSEGFFVGEVAEYTLTIVGDDLPIKETVIIAEADAWTRGRNGSGKSDDNGGDKTDLVASDGNSDNDLREFYLKFDLTNVDLSKIIEAKIVLTTTRESSWESAETNYGGITIQSLYHVSDDSWEEMSITANTKPASGTVPISMYSSDFLIGGTTLSNLEHDFDVTEQLLIEADEKLSVRLNTVNTLGQRIFYASRENTDFAPKLVVVESL